MAASKYLKEKIISEYKVAYKAAAGKDCEIVQKGSWLYIETGGYVTGSAYRLSQLPEMTRRLLERAAISAAEPEPAEGATSE